MGDRRLEDRVALVTGGSRGIGRAIAIALAESGASVAISYSSRRDAADEVVDEIRTVGVAAVAIAADLGGRGAGETLVERSAALLGSPDIVVNNAGINRDGLCVRLRDDDWSSVIDVDLTGAFQVCRAALRPMLRRRWGRIINVASVAGIMGNAGQSNYSAAKAGLIGLTKALSREVGSRGITVNAVAPGFIETDMTAAMPQEALSRAVRSVPLGRLGTPPEAAAAVRFLALPEAGYITGHVLQVDGGLGA